MGLIPRFVNLLFNLFVFLSLLSTMGLLPAFGPPAHTRIQTGIRDFGVASSRLHAFCCGIRLLYSTRIPTGSSFVHDNHSGFMSIRID